jgi:hypothetical protein
VPFWKGHTMPVTPSFNQVYGTINAGNTLSSEINLLGYRIAGVIALSNSVNGTLGFSASDKPDVSGGVYRPVYGANGAAVAITVNSGQWALNADDLKSITGYQYIRISSSAQTNGLAIKLMLVAT